MLRKASKGLEELSAPANSILAARTRRSRRGDNRLRRAPRDDAPCRDAPRELRRPRSTPQRPAGPARPARHSDQASRGPGAAGTRRLGPTPRGGVDSLGERDPVATAHRLGAGFVPPHPYAVDPPPEVRGVFSLKWAQKRARPRVRAGPCSEFSPLQRGAGRLRSGQSAGKTSAVRAGRLSAPSATT